MSAGTASQSFGANNTAHTIKTIGTVADKYSAISHDYSAQMAQSKSVHRPLMRDELQIERHVKDWHRNIAERTADNRIVLKHDEIIGILVLGLPPALDMRVGASDFGEQQGCLLSSRIMSFVERPRQG